MKLRVSGDRELLRDLQRVDDAISDRLLHNAVEAAAEVGREWAELAAPRVTGRGAANIRVEDNPRGVRQKPQRREVHVAPSGEGWYLILHEIGTIYMPAHPFLRPTVQQKGHQMTDEFNKTLRRTVRAHLG